MILRIIFTHSDLLSFSSEDFIKNESGRCFPGSFSKKGEGCSGKWLIFKKKAKDVPENETIENETPENETPENETLKMSL